MTTAQVIRKMSLTEVVAHYPTVTKAGMKMILPILFERQITNQPKLKSAFSRRFIYAAHTGGHITAFLEANPVPAEDKIEDLLIDEEPAETYTPTYDGTDGIDLEA